LEALQLDEDMNNPIGIAADYISLGMVELM